MHHRVIALSTMWGIGYDERMGQLMDKARDMGFTHLELNYQVTETMLAELRARPGLSVSSVHSPCPGREVSGGRWTYRLRLTAEDEEEWRPALEGALGTVDTAVALGAPVMVLHVGSVPLEDGLETRLRDLYKKREGHSSEFLEIRERLLAQREARKSLYLEAAFERVRRIVDYASDRGVMVGLESRYYFHEI
ncbi:MAG: TIM barrel protein, partial [Dehalococcoidia bacterium]|nr:TIM barrel protein [Dehalococcoidia bacterium]